MAVNLNITDMPKALDAVAKFAFYFAIPALLGSVSLLWFVDRSSELGAFVEAKKIALYGAAIISGIVFCGAGLALLVSYAQRPKPFDFKKRIETATDPELRILSLFTGSRRIGIQDKAAAKTLSSAGILTYRGRGASGLSDYEIREDVYQYVVTYQKKIFARLEQPKTTGK